MSTKIVVTTEADVNVVTTTEQLPVTVIESPAVEPQVIVTAGEQGPMGPQGQIGPAGGSAFTRIAGETVSALTAVYEDSLGMVYPLSNTDEINIDLLAGIAITAAHAGADITIQRSGPLDADGINLQPGRVWLGATGALAQTPPENGFDVLLGYATADQRLYIDISESILLED